MSTRILLVLVTLFTGFGLAGCGLSPVYGSYAKNAGGPVAGAFDSVYIDTISDRTGQKLRNLLIDRFYTTGQRTKSDAAYRLSVSSVGESIYGLGIAKDATATRSQIRQTASFSLYSAASPDGRPLITRSISAVTSFNTLASQYTTLVTEEDARNQAIEDLAQQITTMLELYFANPDAFPAPAAKTGDTGKKEPKASTRLRRDHDLDSQYNAYNTPD